MDFYSLKTYFLPWAITKGPLAKSVAKKSLLFGSDGITLRDATENEQLLPLFPNSLMAIVFIFF